MKMVLIRHALLASFSLLVVQGAYAAGPYIGGNYTQIQYENDEYDSDTLKIDSATLSAGFEITDFLALEARAGTGFSSDSKGIAEFDMDHLYGGYAKLGVPVGESLRPYVIGGYTKVKGKVKADGTVGGVSYSVSDTETYEDKSLGAGLDVAITDTVAANLEYMRYVDKDQEDISGISVGLRSAF